MPLQTLQINQKLTQKCIILVWLYHVMFVNTNCNKNQTSDWSTFSLWFPSFQTGPSPQYDTMTRCFDTHKPDSYHHLLPYYTAHKNSSNGNKFQTAVICNNFVSFLLMTLQPFSLFIGGTQGWTGDISICSRMLYHWAILPYFIKLLM